MIAISDDEARLFVVCVGAGFVIGALIVAVVAAVVFLRERRR